MGPYKIEPGDEAPDKQAANEPHEQHDRSQQDEDGANLLAQVGLGQSNACCHDLDGNHNAGKLVRDHRLIAPLADVDELGTHRPENDAADKGNSYTCRWWDAGQSAGVCRLTCFGQIEPLLDDQRAEAVQQYESSENGSDNGDNVRHG